MSKSELPGEAGSSPQDVGGFGGVTAYVSLAALVTAIAATYAGVILTYSRFADAGPVIFSAALACFASAMLALLAALLIWLRADVAKVASLLMALLLAGAFALSAIRLINWAIANGKNPVVVLGPVGAAFGFAVLTLLLAYLNSSRLLRA
jgi:hypothetical protein